MLLNGWQRIGIVLWAAKSCAPCAVKGEQESPSAFVFASERGAVLDGRLGEAGLGERISPWLDKSKLCCSVSVPHLALERT